MSCTGDKATCNCGCSSTFKSEGIIIQFPALIKASISKSGQRIIDFEATCASCDYEGDIITQDAVLKSAEYFIKTGFIDVDHYCELGKNPAYSWLGIKDPDSWQVGKPLDVYDMGEYRTGVKAEIKQNPNGIIDPVKNKYDWLWQKLSSEQGMWRASVFGYPGADTEIGGCAVGTDGYVCASRYLVKSFKWTSTALTRNPINKSLKHPVQIMMAKAFAKSLEEPKMGNINAEALISVTKNKVFYREELRKSYFTHLLINCPETNNGKDVTTFSICKHFMSCENVPYHLADVYSLAISELVKRLK